MAEPSGSPARRRNPGAPRSTRSGPGRLLIMVYGVFAVSASARAGVQLATKFSQAPTAYLLSAFAALIYIVATLALARDSAGARRIAWIAVGIEAIGVFAVGLLTVLDGADFPDATVWSGFGRGYGYVPAVLPVLGLAWLWHTGRPSPDCP